MSDQLPAGGRLYLPSADAKHLHMCVSASAGPVRGKILLPRFKAISGFAKEQIERGKLWKEGGCDTQRDMDVSNVGNDFKRVVERAFGKGKVRRILFPAVYYGRVAKEISNAGFEVICTDIQSIWVENARKLGMEAHIRSAEEFPEGKFDIVASFEPYPLEGRPLGFMLALRTMAETDGLVLLTKDVEPSKTGLSPTKNLRTLGGLEEIVLAYGRYGRGWRNDLEYSVIRATHHRSERARIDLEVLGALEGAERVSVAGLAERLGKEISKVEDSLVRIAGIVRNIYKLLGEYGDHILDKYERSRLLKVATGVSFVSFSCNKIIPEGVTYRDFVQEIEITD